MVMFLGLTAWRQDHEAPRPAAKETVRWMTLKEAAEAVKKEKKPVMIDLYTDWCGWCKVMDKKTYSDPRVAAYINQNFIPVKLDAETREELAWQGKTYKYNQTYGVNTYSLYLTGGQLSFPTTVFLPQDGSGPQPVPGFLEPKDIEVLLKYFGEGHYGKTAFQVFLKNFSNSWK